MARQRTRPYYLVAILGLPALLACSVVSQILATSTPLPTATPTLAPVIETFDGSETALDALDQAILDDPQAVTQSAMAYLQSNDFKIRYAAVYALSLTADASQAEALLPVLEDPDSGLHTIAAGALIGLGRKESIPVLIAALSSDENIPYSEPPTPEWRLAYQALNYYTGQDFDLKAAAASGDAAARTAAAQAWQAWWDQAGAHLQWDATAGRYTP